MKMVKRMAFMPFAALVLNSCGTDQEEQKTSSAKAVFASDKNSKLELKKGKEGFFFDYCYSSSIGVDSCRVVQGKNAESAYFSIEELAAFEKFLAEQKALQKRTRDGAALWRNVHSGFSVIGAIGVIGFILYPTRSVPLYLLNGAYGVVAAIHGGLGVSHLVETHRQNKIIDRHTQLTNEIKGESQEVSYDNLLRVKDHLEEFITEFRASH